MAHNKLTTSNLVHEDRDQLEGASICRELSVASVDHVVWLAVVAGSPRMTKGATRSAG